MASSLTEASYIRDGWRPTGAVKVTLLANRYCKHWRSHLPLHRSITPPFGRIIASHIGEFVRCGRKRGASRPGKRCTRFNLSGLRKSNCPEDRQDIKNQEIRVVKCYSEPISETPQRDAQNKIIGTRKFGKQIWTFRLRTRD